MITISDLPTDFLNEIMSRIPLKYMRAVRLTCKKWDTLLKSQIFTKMHIGAREEGESRMIVLMDYNLYLMSVDVDHPYKEVKGKLTYLDEQVKISQVFHCEGLLLCILEDDATRVVVWNPYWGQTRWIEPRFSHRPNGVDKFNYAIGYEDKESCRSVKFLRFIDYYDPLTRTTPVSQFSSYEIYDFDSDSWTSLVVAPHWRIRFDSRGLSLKGNTYWCATERRSRQGLIDHIICFDFTSERFGPLLRLPFTASDELVTLSCVGEEKLAALIIHDRPFDEDAEIWITTSIEAEKVSWIKFLTLDLQPHPGFEFNVVKGTFLIDEVQKVALLFDRTVTRNTVAIFGEDGHVREVDLGESANMHSCPHVCSYVPSLVQIKKQPAKCIRKRQSRSETCRYKQTKLRLDMAFGESPQTTERLRRRFSVIIHRIRRDEMSKSHF